MKYSFSCRVNTEKSDLSVPGDGRVRAKIFSLGAAKPQSSFFIGKKQKRKKAFLIFAGTSKLRRSVTSVTPCGASKASGAWGILANKTAPRKRHILSPTPSRRNGTVNFFNAKNAKFFLWKGGTPAASTGTHNVV